MLLNLKALVVVLLLATPVFILAKPLCLRFTSPEDFARRRNVWYVLTVCAFVSPSFWLYALVAVPVLAWAGKRDASPTALYVLLFYVVPPVSIDIKPSPPVGPAGSAACRAGTTAIERAPERPRLDQC
jgi:hypothetical protein